MHWQPQTAYLVNKY